MDAGPVGGQRCQRRRKRAKRRTSSWAKGLSTEDPLYFEWVFAVEPAKNFENRCTLGRESGLKAQAGAYLS